MNLALKEVKIRAKIRLKKDKEIHQEGNTKPLKYYLNRVVVDLGFSSWQHASFLLSGKVLEPENHDFGAFLHHRSCDALINQWFSGYAEAKRQLNQEKKAYLLPYKHHFVVADDSYIRAIGIQQEADELLETIGGNFIEGYGSEAWDKLAWCVVGEKFQSV